MTQKLDYSREEAMDILNNENYSDEDKRQIYDKYMGDLKRKRKDKIVERLNLYALNIPIITKEIYISKLKEYENDDLSKPFEIIEQELRNFENEMKSKYDEYLKEKNAGNIEIVPDIKANDSEEETFDDTIFNDPIIEEDEEEVTPSLVISDEVSVLNEEPELLAKPLFDNNSEEVEEIMPDEFNDSEKGNASAIILSIIAVIIGVVVMYSIIRLN
ncbi:MAG: hypothetical protein J6B64_00800 [Bacilli bacterium]|nr:hypothetical protein [Bacilli bacterium]MBP3635410.1 hypothetical protein [Bacilli bacterium]